MFRARSLALLLPLTWKIVGLYVVFSLLWIILTDRILEQVFTDAASLSWAQSVKGTVFIIATATLLTLLIFRFTGKLLVMQAERVDAQSALLHAQAEAKIGSFDWDHQRKRLATSPGLMRLLGLEKEPEDLDALIQALPEGMRQSFAEAISQAEYYQEPTQSELTVALDRDITAWFRFKVEPVFHSEELCGVRGMLQDLTESKRTEQVLTEALKRVQSSDQIKTNFLNNLNHELRTPMNGVVGMSQVMLDTAPASQVQGLQLIYNSGLAMSQVLDNILDLQRLLEGGRKLVFEPVDLYQLARQMEQLFRPSAEVKGLQLDMSIERDLPQWVRTDPYMVHQILTHLVANGVKFTNAGGVRIRFGFEQGWLQLEVEDTGVGIAPEQQERIFERFAQVDESLTRPYDGLGAGLAVVREFAELLGGGVSLKSQPGEGSCFSVRLPLDQARDIDEYPVMVPQPIRSVLIADDDHTSCLLLQMMLESRSCRTQIARDGKTALDTYFEGRFELLILDLMMPQIDGLEVARRIRQAEQESGTDPVRLVALTAMTQAEIPKRCRTAGFDLCLFKPLTLADLDQILGVHPEVPAESGQMPRFP